ncbi:MAG: hypothetical protein ACK5LK_08485, partial [Chthoniobacterales bacterium]
MKSKPKKPIEIVTEKGVSVPIYYSPVKAKGAKYDSFVFSFIQNGSRQRRRASSLDKARATAKTVARQLAEGTGHVHALTPSVVADYTAASKLLRSFPKSSLTAAIGEWCKAKETLGEGESIVTACQTYRRKIEDALGVTPKLFSEVVELFLEQLKEDDASERYQGDCRSKLRTAAKAFQCHIHTIEASDLQDWLKSLRVAPRTRLNMRRNIATLFFYAKGKGYLPRDKQTEAELIPKDKKTNARKRGGTI